MVNNNSDIHVIERLSPDIYFGYLAGERLNFTHVHDIYDLYGQVGYERTSYLLGGLLQTFDNRKQSRKEILENGTA